MNFYQKNRKTPVETAFFAALAVGFFTHMFALVNVLQNIDNIGNQPFGYGAGITSGRWLLSLIGDLSQYLGGNYNLPFINGAFFLACVAIAAGLLVSLFQIRSRSSAALIGMLLAVFPSAAVALVYRFTSVYYGIAFLLSILAVWVFERHKYGTLLSALCIACSLGIYQAYVSVTISIFVMLLIQRALQKDDAIGMLIRRGLRECLALLMGLGLYFLFLKVCLWGYGTALSSYNGMDTMGKMELGKIPHLLWETFYYFWKFPLLNYCGLAGSKLLKLAYVLLGSVSAGLVVCLLIFRVKNLKNTIAIGLLCLIFPFAVNFVMIMGPDAWIYTMMVYSFALVACFPLILLECMPHEWRSRWRKIAAKTVGGLVLLIVVSYSYVDNINYSAQYYVDRQVENYISSIVSQVRMTKGFDPEKKWALIGEIRDPLLDSPWENERQFGGTFGTERTLNDISQYAWFENYIGYRIPEVDENTMDRLCRSETVASMPCWPSEGSIRIVGDTVVIKFQELSK